MTDHRFLLLKRTGVGKNKATHFLRLSSVNVDVPLMFITNRAFYILLQSKAQQHYDLYRAVSLNSNTELLDVLSCLASSPPGSLQKTL